MYKDNKFVMKIKQFYKRLTNSSANIYITILGIFAILFGVVLTSPITIGSSYNFEDTPLNEYYSINNDVSIALVKREYNKSDGILRFDFMVKDPGTNKSFSNVNFKIYGEDIKTRTIQDAKVTRINDQYYVAIFENIPEGFEVFSTTLEPFYVQPDIESDSNNLDERIYKVYTNDSEKIINKDLKPLSDAKYQLEFYSFQQEEIEKEITSMTDEVRRKELIISDIEEQNSKLEGEMQFQTEVEKIETQNAINANLNSIEQREKEISELGDQVSNLEDKIKLIDERKQQTEK